MKPPRAAFTWIPPPHVAGPGISSTTLFSSKTHEALMLCFASQQAAWARVKNCAQITSHDRLTTLIFKCRLLKTILRLGFSSQTSLRSTAPPLWLLEGSPATRRLGFHDVRRRQECFLYAVNVFPWGCSSGYGLACKALLRRAIFWGPRFKTVKVPAWIAVRFLTHQRCSSSLGWIWKRGVKTL